MEGATADKREEVGGGVVRWERFLPRMVLRVLLVEADDSTRQIIAPLLRKCSYRVAAVPDGLKAWEALKARPHNIDLILTEGMITVQTYHRVLLGEDGGSLPLKIDWYEESMTRMGKKKRNMNL